MTGSSCRSCKYAIGFFGLILCLTVEADGVQNRPPDRFFAAVGSLIQQNDLLRTQFTLTNSQPRSMASGSLAPPGPPKEGVLYLFTDSGAELEVPIETEWVGLSGSVQVETGRVFFSVPPASSLVLTLKPVVDGGLGWAQLQADAGLEASADLQLADLAEGPRPGPSDFEHYVERIVETKPVEGCGFYEFPIWFFVGLKNINTAFAIVNLSGVIGSVDLTLFQGSNQISKKSVRLRPGELVAHYFDQFWELAFPEIFPFEMRARARVESALPLGITVFRTINLRPVTTVSASPQEPEADREVEAGFEFVLEAGQAVIVQPGSLRLELSNIVEDSRCPSDVVCVWEGEVIVELKASTAGSPATVLRLSSQADGSVVRFKEYSIRLVQVEPVPVSTRQLEITDYRVTLLVSQEP